MAHRDEHPLPRSDSWTPSNLNLSAQGAMVEEARADGCAWSPSYLNLGKSEECICPPGQPMLESPQGREQETATRPAMGMSTRTIGEGDHQRQMERQTAQQCAPAVDPALICTCKKSHTVAEDQLAVHSPTPSVDKRPDSTTPVYQERCINVCPGLCRGPDVGVSATPDAPRIQESQPREERDEGGGALDTRDDTSTVRESRPPSKIETITSVAAPQISLTNLPDKTGGALEDVYVWEARSYTGSTESEEMEKLRLAGRAPLPMNPGERSEEELRSSMPQEQESYPQDRMRAEKESSPPASKKASEIIPKDGGKDGPESAVTALEDIYVWEAKSYTGSADSDALEELRLAGKSPIPKGPGERSAEEDSVEQIRPEEAVPDRESPEKGGFPADGRCFPTCPGDCKNLPWPPGSGTLKTALPPPRPQDGPRRPCGCRESSDQLRQGEGGQDETPKPEKKPCLCDPGDEEPHPKCVCKHCQKKRIAQGKEGPLQPQWDYELSAEPYSGPAYRPGDEKGFPDNPPGLCPTVAGGADTGGQRVCPPCPVLDAKPSAQSTGPVEALEPIEKASQGQLSGAVIGLREATSAKCFCKPTVHDRVEYLTNLLRRGISPLRKALEDIEKKMRAMGFSEFGNDGRPQMGGSGSMALASYGGGTTTPIGGAGGKEPSVAIYIMAPNAALGTTAPQMVPALPSSHLQQNQKAVAYDQPAGTQMHGKNSCRCILTANKMHNLGTVLEENEMHSDPRYNIPEDKDKVTLYLRGNFTGAPNNEVCCQIPCCQQRPRTAQPYSKP